MGQRNWEETVEAARRTYYDAWHIPPCPFWFICLSRPPRCSIRLCDDFDLVVKTKAAAK